MSAKAVAGLVSDACRDLYMGKPGDDTTVAALRIRERQLVNLMIGPPVNPEDDEKIMRLFFGQGGKTIVCRGHDLHDRGQIPAHLPSGPASTTSTPRSRRSALSRAWTCAPRGCSR